MTAMTDAYEVIRHNDRTIRLYPDPEPTNPREEFDSFGTMVCWHSRYELGDAHEFVNPEEFHDCLVQDALTPDEADRYGRIETLLDEIDRRHGEYEWDDVLARGRWKIAPSHRARHRWLAEQLAAMRALALDRYVRLPLYLYDHSGITMRTSTFSDPRDSGQVGWIYVSMDQARANWPGRDDVEVRELAEKVLQGEVEEYDQHLTGDVWGYVVEDEDGEELASCWGLFGLQYAREAAKAEADALATAA